jgi:hypothetical protein
MQRDHEAPMSKELIGISAGSGVQLPKPTMQDANALSRSGAFGTDQTRIRITFDGFSQT